MRLESPAFGNRSRIPGNSTCDGVDVSPPLQWFDPSDPDAPGGIWHHWASYNILALSGRCQQGAAAQAKAIGFEQAIGDVEEAAYGGPCPPRGHGTHHFAGALSCRARRRNTAAHVVR